MLPLSFVFLENWYFQIHGNNVNQRFLSRAKPITQFSLGPVFQLEFVLVLIIVSQCSQIDVLYSVSWSS